MPSVHMRQLHTQLHLFHKVILWLTFSFCFLSTHLNAEEVHPSPAKLKEVNLQLKWRHQFQFSGYYAAQAKGFYQAEGLKVNILEGGASNSSVDAVTSGKAQYGVSDSEIMLDYAQGSLSSSWVPFFNIPLISS